MVSGPAAGLTAIVLPGSTGGSFSKFLPAVVFGGVLQIVLGLARGGVIGYYFPSSVIKGMLAAIGLTLILKQIPHAVGYDRDYVGDFAYAETSGETTFSAIGHAFQQVQPAAIAVALLGLLVFMWPRTPMARLRLLPAPLAVVRARRRAQRGAPLRRPRAAIRDTHLVTLPTSPSDLLSQFVRPTGRCSAARRCGRWPRRSGSWPRSSRCSASKRRTSSTPTSARRRRTASSWRRGSATSRRGCSAACR
jgi:hypothetical protein